MKTRSSAVHEMYVIRRQHFGLLPLILGVAFAPLHPCSGQQPGRINRPVDEFLHTADEMFGTLFGETDQERRAIESVEIDIRQERQIGNDALKVLLAQLHHQAIPIERGGRDVEYVQTLVDRLRPLMRNANRYPAIEVYVADTKQIDARAFPGGSVVVTSGLLGFADSEAAFVGILAHELSHIDQGHQLRWARASALARRGEPSNPLLLMKQFARPFRADDEARADIDAANWINQLDYDPMEMADLFRRLATRYDEQRTLPDFLRTHPYFADRYSALRAFVQQQQANGHKVGRFVGRENLTHRTARD